MGVGWKHIFYFLNKNSLYKDKYTQPQKVPQEDLSWFVVVVVVVIRSNTGMLCIVTRFRVLRAPESWSKHFSDVFC